VIVPLIVIIFGIFIATRWRKQHPKMMKETLGKKNK